MGATATATNRVQVRCVTTSNQHGYREGITHLGGQGWYWTVEQVIADIDDRLSPNAFFTNVNGRSAWVETVHTHNGTYLRSVPDGTTEDNLLKLGSCRL